MTRLVMWGREIATTSGGSRRSSGMVLAIAILAAAMATLPLAPAAAQVRIDSTARGGLRLPPAPQRLVPDSLKPPLSPGRAFLYSFILPGLAQGRLQHHFAGAIYTTVEGVAIAMLTKTANDLRIARAHLHDHVVKSYTVDPVTGAPVLDNNGDFQVADTVDTHYGAELEDARRTHYEDWVAILIFNHLFAGADAFVSSLLWDLPAEVQYRVLPHGDVGVGVRIRW